MDFATRFVVKLKSYFDTIPLNVWCDFERNLLPDRTWDENSILRTSILRDGFDKTDRLGDANENPVYKLDVKSHDYGGKLEETLTGADIALIFRVEINRSLFSQRIVLVQLKRANFDNRNTSFPALHHRSGAGYYGRDLHQAQKMLLFSSTSVYWFAMTSGILEDEVSLTAYCERSSLSSKQTHPARSDFDSGTSYGPQDLLLSLFPWQPGAFPPSLAPRELEMLVSQYLADCYDYSPYRNFMRHMGGLDASTLARNLKYAWENEPYRIWHLLRSRLQAYAYDNFGLQQRAGLFVCSAEDIYALSHAGRCSFVDLYSKSIPFTQFMLGSVFSEGFGDPSADLIHAVQLRDVRGYFRTRVQQLADAHELRVPGNLADLPPVRSAITVTLQVNTTTASPG